MSGRRAGGSKSSPSISRPTANTPQRACSHASMMSKKGVYVGGYTMALSLYSVLLHISTGSYDYWDLTHFQ